MNAFREALEARAKTKWIKESTQEFSIGYEYVKKKTKDTHTKYWRKVGNQALSHRLCSIEIEAVCVCSVTVQQATHCV